MDPIFMHLRVNHFPIVLVIVGAVAAVIAAISRKDAVWRYAAITLLLAGLSAPLAYWTGLRAEDAAESIEVIDQSAMAEHEESALWAGIGLVLVGVAAGFALAKPSTLTRTILLVLAVLTTISVGYTGWVAGKIVHGDFTMQTGDEPK